MSMSSDQQRKDLLALREEMQKTAMKYKPAKGGKNSKICAKHASSKHGSQIPSLAKPRGKPRKRKLIIRPADYTWNRGGRLKEIRIRYHARKYAQIWKNKVFGRLTYTEARKYYQLSIVKRCFVSWKKEWWDNCYEWKLQTKAEVHHRFQLTLTCWKTWLSYTKQRREKKRLEEIADSHFTKISNRKHLKRWKVYIRLKRMKMSLYNRGYEHASNKRLGNAWKIWREAISQREKEKEDEYIALQHWAHQTQCSVWNQWSRRAHQSICVRQALLVAKRHECQSLLRRSMIAWFQYLRDRREKLERVEIAINFRKTTVRRSVFQTWNQRLKERERFELRERKALLLSRRFTKRRFMVGWQSYIRIVDDKMKKIALANIHYRHKLMRDVVSRLLIASREEKKKRENLYIASKFHLFNMKRNTWRRWQNHMDKIDDENMVELNTIAHRHFKFRAQRRYFDRLFAYMKWRKRRHRQTASAQTHYINRALPKYFGHWRTWLQEQKDKQERNEMAASFRSEVLMTKYYFSWYNKYDEIKEVRTMERMAIMQNRENLLRRFWRRWITSARSIMRENRKTAVSLVFYRRLLLKRAFRHMQQFSTSSIYRNRQMKFARDYHQQTAKNRIWSHWRRYVEAKKKKQEKTAEMDARYNDTLMKKCLHLWMGYHEQVKTITVRGEDWLAQRNIRNLRTMFSEWRGKTSEMKISRVLNQTADAHYSATLKKNYYKRWNMWTNMRMYKRNEKNEQVESAREILDSQKLKNAFLRWRWHRMELTSYHKKEQVADDHHNKKLIGVAFQAMRVYRYVSLRKSLLQHQADIFKKRRIQRTYFSVWIEELTYKRQEEVQTGDSLWHWALNLESKCLQAWRQYTVDKKEMKRRLESAMEDRRQMMLRTGCQRILTHYSHATEHRYNQRTQIQTKVLFTNFHLAWKYGRKWLSIVRAKSDQRWANRRRRVMTSPPQSRHTPPPPHNNNMIVFDRGDHEYQRSYNNMKQQQQQSAMKTTSLGEPITSSVGKKPVVFQYPSKSSSSIRHRRPEPRLPHFLDESLRREGLLLTTSSPVTSPSPLRQHRQQVVEDSEGMEGKLSETHPIPTSSHHNNPLRHHHLAASTRPNCDVTTIAQGSCRKLELPPAPAHHPTSSSNVGRERVTSSTLRHQNSSSSATTATSNSSKNKTIKNPISQPPLLLLPPSAFSSPSPSGGDLLQPTPTTTTSSERTMNDDAVAAMTQASCTFFVASKTRTQVRDELMQIKTRLKKFHEEKEQLKVLKQQKQVLSRLLDNNHTPNQSINNSSVLDEVQQLTRDIEKLSSVLEEKKPSVERDALRIRVLSSRPNNNT